MNAGEAELGPIENWHPKTQLVARPHLDVEVRALPKGGAAFLAALDRRRAARAGRRSGGCEEDAEFDLAANLAGLIGAGLVTGISTEHQKG